MQEKYLINANIHIIRQPEELSVKFRGNINSVGAFIPLMTACLLAVILGLVALSSDSITPAKFLYSPQLGFGFLAFLFSVFMCISEATLTYEIHVTTKYLSLISRRLNFNPTKTVGVDENFAIRKIIVEKAIGDTGQSRVHWPTICIQDLSKTYLVPVTLNNRDVDEIVDMINNFIHDF
jgi:hypothetical protein